MNTAINHYESFPDAQYMLEALRGMDYTPASAIADLIDNSISANATEVYLLFLSQNDNNPKPIVVIADNGNGMTFDELRKAMRLGGVNPRDTRDITDLGRFGLGLKTASFSQCRRLTVFPLAGRGRVFHDFVRCQHLHVQQFHGTAGPGASG